MVSTVLSPEVNSAVSLATMTKIMLVVEYDGTRYFGFQLQADCPTIQGELEEALLKLTGERTRVIAASRTDTGVHAKGQVVSFRTRSAHSPETFVKGLNHYLPRDIAVKATHRVRLSFNVRSDAASREYQYYILNSRTRSPLVEKFTYLVKGGLDIELMNMACQALIGEHDFASFASRVWGRIKTIRTIYTAEFVKKGDMVTFNIVANSFLPHQVRNTVGALVRVGLGKMRLDEFHSIRAEKKPGLAGPTAPACGLCLVQVNYPRPFEEEI